MSLANLPLRFIFAGLLLACLGHSPSIVLAHACPLPLTPGPTVRVDPASVNVEPGQPFTVHVMVEGAMDLGAFQFDMAYDPAVVTVTGVALGPFLGSTGRTAQSLGSDIDNTVGSITFAAFSFGGKAGPQGMGVLAIVTLTAVGPGTSALNLQGVVVTDALANALPTSVQGGTVAVSAPTPTLTLTAMPSPTATPTVKPVPTSAATAAVTAEPVTTATPTEAATATSEATATAAATPVAARTATPVAARTATPVPSVTPVPAASATPTLAETSEPEPTAMATRTPSPLPTPTARVLLSASPVPSASPTAGPHRPPCCLPVGGIALAVPGWMLCALLRRYGK